MRYSTAIDQSIATNFRDNQLESFKEAATIWNTIYRVNGLITMGSQILEIQTLDEILDLGRRARVKDPRDKVYGLLGLLPDDLADQISPDYDLTYEKVYVQFATVMIESYKSMDPIFSWCSFDASASSPSWVPDWTTEFTRNRIQWLKRRSASGSSAASWSISNDSRVLRSKGFIVDTVETTGASQSENMPYRAVLPHSAQHARSSSRISVEAREDPVAYSLRRTLIMWDRTGQPSMLDIPWLDWEAMDTSPRYLGLGIRRIISNPFWRSFDRFRHTNAYFNIFGRSLRDFFPNRIRHNLV
jgi:hypothetical protein